RQEPSGQGSGLAEFQRHGLVRNLQNDFLRHNFGPLPQQKGRNVRRRHFLSGVGVNTQYVGWGAGFLDYDNDGWPDILYVTGHVYPEIDNYKLDQKFRSPCVVYRNLGTGKFKDVSSQMGPGITALHSSRGSAYGDYDNDGDVDA